ncbi:hypothetical protein QJU96_09550 [Pasteurella skyensis]|uniref:Uncharacterized protein n=1 Tax=Phocoenobacter skyensis TaxID=97481 RepID=A0AAJ6NEN8_9PAST|nr:hypothetical protein [Pasteurella skyensis]MDP8171524.1 hypothetical protein [Pasteurella skyensis]MDP8175426.1 hypothetical protein [Pasteurella skyensis]
MQTIKIEGTNFFLSVNDPDVKKVVEKYGDTHVIKARKGCEVRLDELEDNESVVCGDGENYHFVLTPKEAILK